MANPYTDLHALTVRRAPSIGPLVQPPRRWVTRLLPGLLLASFAALVVWASWDLLVSSTPVTVVPVLARTGIVQSQGVELFSATGWIEPRPTPIEVSALTEGVVKKLLVLQGQQVQPDDVIAELIEDDARQARDLARETLAERRAQVATAQAAVTRAERERDKADVLARAKEDLLNQKVIGKLEVEQARAVVAVAEAEIGHTRAQVDEAKARERQADVAVAMAQLRFDRMKVRTPVAGVVMSLNTLPGRMVGVRSLAANMPESLVTLYDPQQLQVRVEVPLDKFELVRPGQPATVEVDVFPGRRLLGLVLYDTHETDIQRNTVRVKVALQRHSGEAFAWPWPICLPAHAFAQSTLQTLCLTQEELLGPRDKLRPGMIAKVRILSPPTTSSEKGGEVLRIFIPKRLVVTEDGKTQVWIVDQASSRAVLRPIVLGPAQSGDQVEVAQGLQPSDKLISSGRESLKPGQRVRIGSEEQ